jgi:hypothetical protein
MNGDPWDQSDRDTPPKITDQVAEIVRDYEGGRRLRELADEHGVTPETVGSWIRSTGTDLRPRGPRARVTDGARRREVRMSTAFREELRQRGRTIGGALLDAATAALDSGVPPAQGADGLARVRPRIDGELWRRAERVGQAMTPPRGASAALVALARAWVDFEKSRDRG